MLDLSIPCPFVLPCLALGRNIQRQNRHLQRSRNERLFLPTRERDGFIGSAPPPDCPCAGWPEQPGRLRELQLRSQARRSCTFFYFHLNTSHGKAKRFSSDQLARQIKARLAVCLLVTLWGMIYCLSGSWAAALLGRGTSWGTPARWTPPGWLGLACTRPAGAEAEGPATAGQWSEDLQKRRLLLPTLLRSSRGLRSQQHDQAEVTH